jgi:hypothetical protein
MNDYDDNEELDESEEKEISSIHHNQTNEETQLENDLAKEFQTNLKISVTDESPDIGPTPYKVAIVGMNELGSATAFLLICKQVVTDVIIIDRDARRLAGINLATVFFCTSVLFALF